MCEYCNAELGAPANKWIREGLKNARIWKEFNGAFTIQVGEGITSVCFKINFCPMCGRKLTEVK